MNGPLGLTTPRAADPLAGDEAPIAPSQSHRLARGHWMESRAILSRTGRIDVSTRTWSKSEGAGFHGAVVVFLVDEHRNRLSSTRPQSYGVNSKHLPDDDRTDAFHEPVPVDRHVYRGLRPRSSSGQRHQASKPAGGCLPM